jgi:hypothetical protein
MNIQSRISELIALQKYEVDNDFPNGDMWNELDDKIWRLENYGQENPLEDILNEDGWVIGQRYEDGREIYHQGMTFENSY